MLKGILAISGQPGLFKVLSEGKNGVIVESLLTGKKQTAFASAKMSTLIDIAIYTTSEDFPLKQVFKKIYDLENGGPAIQTNAKPEDLKKYFEKILPDFDRERVYVSDIKKVLTWYNLLQDKGLLTFEEAESAEGEEQSAEGTEQSAESAEQSAQSTEQSAESTEQSGESTEQSGESTEQSAESTEQSAESTEQSADDREQGA